MTTKPRAHTFSLIRELPFFLASTISVLVSLLVLYLMITVYYLDSIDTFEVYQNVLLENGRELIDQIDILQLSMLFMVSLVLAGQAVALRYIVRRRRYLFRHKTLSITVPIIIRTIIILLLSSGAHIFSILYFNFMYTRFSVIPYLEGKEVYVLIMFLLLMLSIRIWYQMTHPLVKNDPDPHGGYFKRFE